MLQIMSVRVVLLLCLVGTNESVQNYGLLSNIISGAVNVTIRNVAAQLGNITKNGITTVDTNHQEFGRFILDLHDIKITGFEETIGEIINITPWPLRVNNVTFYVPKLTLQCSDYNLDGFLLFPLSNQNISLKGSNGTVKVELYNVRASIYLLPKLNSTTIWIQESQIKISTSTMTVNLVNLMGGGAVGNTFNTVLNDSATLAFDYYKEAVISHYSQTINDFITTVICIVVPDLCKLGQYYYNFIDKWFEYYNSSLLTYVTPIT